MSDLSKLGLLRPSLLALAAVGLAALSLTGCSLQTTSDPSEIAMPAVSGRIMGGETPVAGSQVTLWETDPGNTGYGLTAHVLAGPVTSSSPGGNFSFTTGYTCTSGNFVYATSTGGDVTNGSSSPMINPNLVMVSAMGSCSNFSTAAAQGGVTVVINELTTIAAAYALGSFTTVNANGSVGTQLVYIGAPTKNNAATGSCTGVGSAMACTAAGLAHAFANATNLVDSVHYNGGFPQGATNANITVPGNSLGSVPEADIDMLANIISYCSTNSAGGSGTSVSGGTDGSACGNLFADAKPVSCTSTSCVATDTLSATIDIAKNPSHNISGLYALASATGPFQPTLSAAPQNLAISITYSGISGSAFGSPQYLALDANDDVYVVSGDVPAALTTQAGVSAMSSNGSSLWNNGYSTSFCIPAFIATDTVGNVWVDNDVSSTTVCGSTTGNYFVDGFSQTTGAATTAFNSTGTISGQSLPGAVAVDQYNNVYYDRTSSTCTSCVFKIAYSAGASTGGTYSAQTVVSNNSVFTTPGYEGEILFDGNQNLWFSTARNSSTGTPQGLFVAPNTNAANYSTGGVPAYSVSSLYYYLGPGASDEGYSFGLAIDSSGNAWDTASNGATAQTMEMTTPTTGGVISGNPAPTSTATTLTGSETETKPYETQFDGLGQLWYTYYSTSGEIYFVWNPLGTAGSSGIAQSNKGIVPCYAPAGATTCSGVVVYEPRSLQIDSTGSVWVAGIGSNTAAPGNGNVVQIIGPGNPVWPQLSYAHFGVEPQ